jgi:hypothetical protein
MAIEFVIAFRPGAVELSIPGTDFSKTAEIPFPLGGRDIGSDISLMKQLTATLHRESLRRMSLKHLALKLFDQFDYTITNETTIPEERMAELAEALPVHLRLRRLGIDGRDMSLPLWRRNLEYWLRLFVVEVLPLVMLFFSFLFMPAPFWSNPMFFLTFLFAVLYLCRFLGKGLWMLAVRRLVPRGYLLALLLARRPRLSLFDRFWMRLVWKPAVE